MATKKTEATETTEQAVQEAEYTVAEFAAVAATVFNASPDIVTAALRVAGIEKTTKSAALEIVEKFRKKEV